MSSIGQSRPWLRFRKSIAILAITAFGAVGLTAIPATAAPEFARPDGDIETSGWNTPPLYDKLDEAVADSAFVYTASAGHDFEVSLSDVADPVSSDAHVLRVVAKRHGGNSSTSVVELREGTEVRASLTVSPASGGFQPFEHTLSVAEADSISSYSNLSVRVVHTNGGATDINQVEFEVPEAGPPPPTCDVVGTETKTSDLVIQPGEHFCVEPGSTLIMNNSSILNYGELELRGSGDPADPTEIIFTNIDESLFVGGGMGPVDAQSDVLATDPGLWNMGDGMLDIVGTPKTSWTRTPDTAEGWLEDDELRSTPVEPGVIGTSPDDFPTYDPETTVPTTTTELDTYTAEVMNLSRDVVVRGQDEEHRAHIFSRSTAPQTLKYATFQFLGPRKFQGNTVKKITGRWAVHLHHSEEGSDGSVIEGNVVRNIGGHAIVAHASDGVLVKRNVAFQIQEDAYWWDLFCPNPLNCSPGTDPETTSDNVDYIENLAADVKSGDTPDPGGMFFAQATNSSMIGNVMVGVRGGNSSDPSGFMWTSNNGHAGWDVQDNVAHNNHKNGGWIYGNPSCPNDLNGFTFYNNRDTAGLGFASYDAGYQINDLTASGSPYGMNIGSVGKLCYTDGAPNEGKTTAVTDATLHGNTAAIRISGHVKPGTVPFTFVRCDLYGPEKVHYGPEDNERGVYDFVDCTSAGGAQLERTEIVFDNPNPNSAIRIQQTDCEAWSWTQGVWTSIPAFYDTETC